MVVYVGAITAGRKIKQEYKTSFEFQGQAVYYVCASVDEAEGRGRREAREKWPEKEGWSEHGVALGHITLETLQKTVGLLTKS